MRFLVDECTGPAVARWLREQQHDVFSVYEQARGMDDGEIVRNAFAEKRILITNDKDFGEKVYRERWPHKGIVLLRLDDERAEVHLRRRRLQDVAVGDGDHAVTRTGPDPIAVPGLERVLPEVP